VRLEGRKAVLQPFISILAQPLSLNPSYSWLSSWHRYRRPRVVGASLYEAPARVARESRKDQD
jgi:hypothetical protein